MQIHNAQLGERGGRENFFMFKFFLSCHKIQILFHRRDYAGKALIPTEEALESQEGVQPFPFLGQLRVGSTHFLRVTRMKGGRERAVALLSKPCWFPMFIYQK